MTVFPLIYPPFFSFEFCCPQRRPANLYQPPISQAEVDLWSNVHLRCLATARHVAKKILGAAGADRDEVLRSGPYLVALKRAFIPEIWQTLNRGAWVCLYSGAYGENLPELYAHVHRCSYRDAILALASEAKLMENTKDITYEERIRNWSQEQNPLDRDFSASYVPPYYPWNSSFLLYYNPFRHVILQAIRWIGADGNAIRVYRSRWHHYRAADSQWAEILPQSPLPLFNGDLLQIHPDCPVILVQDEFCAVELGQRHSGALFSSVPGGLKNLMSANLEPLRGRLVRVVMSPDEVTIGKQIEYALRKSGVDNMCFSFALDEAPRSFDELESAAAKRGVLLLPPPSEKSSVHVPIIISAAGEAIPGGDEVRSPLFYPSIFERDLVWLFAPSKIGKTLIGLKLAHAGQRGNQEVGPLRTVEPFDVLYVDGEMHPDGLQKAIEMVMAGAGDPPGPPPFATICAKCQDSSTIDITSEEWQKEIEKALIGKKLVIFDNFQSLTSNGLNVVNQLLPWLKKLSRKGIAVIILDHTNRDGDIQGSIAKERIADLLISVSYPDDSAKRDGRILVEYTRARRLHGADAEPFQLRKVFTEDSFRLEIVEPNKQSLSPVRPQILKMALVVFAKNDEGLSYPKIQEKYCIPQATAHGDYQKAAKLTADDKTHFDLELQRLRAGGSPFACR